MSQEGASVAPGARNFGELSAGFDARQWHLLGALACERRLSMAQLEKLSAEYGAAEPLSIKAWVDSGVRAGLLVDAGVAYTLVSTRTPGAERAFALAAAYRPLVLRRAAQRGELPRVRGEARAVVGEASLSEFLGALYAGDVAALEPAVARLKGRLPHGEEAAFARQSLREAVCVAFAPAVFERIWQSSALLVAEQVLGDALYALDSVEGLYDWALACGRRQNEDEDANARLVQVLCEHALLRADSDTVSVLAKRLPTAEQLSFDAAARYVQGDLAGARALLADAVAFREKNKTIAAYTANAAPLLALIALVDEHETGAELARRLLRTPVEQRATGEEDLLATHAWLHSLGSGH